jgi:hypothetical protein
VASVPENGNAPAEPRDGRPRSVGGGDANRTYPTPSEMFLKIGVTIVIALCVGLAGELLFNALTH